MNYKFRTRTKENKGGRTRDCFTEVISDLNHGSVKCGFLRVDIVISEKTLNLTRLEYRILSNKEFLSDIRLDNN